MSMEPDKWKRAKAKAGTSKNFSFHSTKWTWEEKRFSIRTLLPLNI